MSLSFEEKESAIVELDDNIICRTIMGKPIKPKTLGQKKYVDLIRDKMIVFGVGMPVQVKPIWQWQWQLQP